MVGYHDVGKGQGCHCTVVTSYGGAACRAWAMVLGIDRVVRLVSHYDRDGVSAARVRRIVVLCQRWAMGFW